MEAKQIILWLILVGFRPVQRLKEGRVVWEIK